MMFQGAEKYLFRGQAAQQGFQLVSVELAATVHLFCTFSQDNNKKIAFL
jgi:hypothetical protein